MQNSALERYSRQINLAQFGYKKQKSLTNAHAVIVGLGGLGSPAALYLAASGLGKLSLIDHDTVELSNLARQIAHTESRLTQAKAHSAAKACRARNSEIEIGAYTEALSPSNASTYLAGADIVLDCTDNLRTRQLIGRQCLALDLPLVFAAAVGFEGQLSVFGARSTHPDSPCYHCLYGEQTRDQSCQANGVLSPVVGLMGVYQALEAIKVLSQTGNPSIGRLQLFDALAGQWHTLQLKRQPHCTVCQ